MFAEDGKARASPVIDSHIHLYDPAKPGGVPWPPKSDINLYSPHLPQQFREATNKLGVLGAVVIEANANADDNQWVFDLAKDHPMIVGYIARLTPGQPGFSENFNKYVENPIFRGLRLGQSTLLQGLEQTEFKKDIQHLADRRLALDLIGEPAMLPVVTRLAQLAPGLKIIVDHLPFKEWDEDPAAMRRALDVVARLPNVFAKFSNVVRRVDGRLMEDAGFYRPGLDALLELFGDDRILYGSNWPVSDSIAPYDKIFRIVADYFDGQSAGIAEKFFWKNSFAAYRWVPRGDAAVLREK